MYALSALFSAIVHDGFVWHTPEQKEMFIVAWVYYFFVPADNGVGGASDTY